MTVSRSRSLVWLVAQLISLPLLVSLGSVWMTQASLAENFAIWSEPEEPVLLSAVGDIMIQNSLRAFAERNGGYDVLFRYVAPALQRSDLVFGNLESPVAPRTGKPRVGYRFNLDSDVLEPLRKAGFDVLSFANNHSHDQGVNGVKETLENFSAAGMSLVGVRTEPETAPRLDLTVKGVRITFLAYTMLTNREVDKHKFPQVALWDNTLSLSEIAKARTETDFLVVSVHWGEEYAVKPSARQERAAAAICEAGADLILGHHPHTLQPIRSLSTKDGRFCIVAYSLGNFVSNMSRHYSEGAPIPAGDPRDSIILQVLLRRGANPLVSFVPLWMVNSADFKGVVPLEKLCSEAIINEPRNPVFPDTAIHIRHRALRSALVLREGETALSYPSHCVTAISAHLRVEPRKPTSP